MPLVPTFAPATNDTAASDEVDVPTVDDEEKADGFPLVPTFATETDDATSDEVNGATIDGETDNLLLAPTFAPETDETAGTAEVNVTTRGDEETGGLLLAPKFATETDDATGSDEVNAATIKSLDSSSSPVC